VVLDFQGHITHINPAGLDLLGLKFEEARDRTYAELFMDEPEMMRSTIYFSAESRIKRPGYQRGRFQEKGRPTP